MSTETKVVTGIVIATLLIIIGGIFAVNKKSTNTVNLNIKQELLNRADAPRTGSSTKVTIVEFADFECPACATLNPQLKKLLETDGDKFTLIYRHFPLHAHSVEAASAALAAGEQGKFWEMGDILYARQAQWSQPNANRTALFESYAEELGLNLEAFKVSAADKKHEKIIERDRIDAVTMGINSTPTLVINGEKAIRGAVPYETLRQIILEAAGMSTSTSATTTQ